MAKIEYERPAVVDLSARALQSTGATFTCIAGLSAPNEKCYLGVAGYGITRHDCVNGQSPRVACLAGSSAVGGECSAGSSPGGSVQNCHSGPVPSLP